MDSPWLSMWRPTLYLDDIKSKFEEYVKNNPDLQCPDKETIRTLELRISRYTRKLRRNPYDPKIWLDRAKALLQLRYPELAVGDSYKALLLITSHAKPASCRVLKVELDVTIKTVANVEILSPHGREQQVSNHLWQSKSSLESKAVLLLGQALFLANSFEECLEITKNEDQYEHWRELTALHSLVSSAYLEEMNYHLRCGDNNMSEIKSLLAKGTILAQPYPWLADDMQSRDKDTISAIRGSLSIKSQGKCNIDRSHDIKNTQDLCDGSGKEIEVLGIFAAIDLSGDEQILVDGTALSAASETDRLCSCCCGPFLGLPWKVACCGRNFCSVTCYKIACTYYHQDPKFCKDRCEETYDAHVRAVQLWENSDNSPRPLGESEETSARLLLRVLTSTVIAHRRSNTHPLKAPVLNRLTSVFGRTDKINFSLESDIAQPIKILQELGIDVFANQNFDTWVIQIIQHRIRMNSWQHSAQDTKFVAISPLFSFFNHSCNPNVMWDSCTANTTLTMHTTRDVKVGEELFISYLPENDLQLPVHMRQEGMKPWTDQCQCRRCAEELQELENAQCGNKSDEEDWAEDEDASCSESE